MSDFLSNFTSDKYKKDAEEQELVMPDTEIPETAMENVTPDLSEVANYDAVLADTTVRGLSCEMLDEETNAEDFNEITDVKNFNDTSEDKLDNENFNDVSDDELASFLRELADVSSEDDLVVKDQFFAKKQKIKRGIIAGSGLLAVIVITWFYYGQTHVKLPDFIGKSVSTAQTWADEHKVKLEVKRVYNFDKEANIVIKESDKNRTISKKKTVNLTASLGANPKEKIELPDFSKMPVAEAREFIKKNKLENTSVQLDYSETVAKDTYLKQTFANQSVTPETFKREDNLTLYYSKGKEPVVQNIDVPDFSSQTKEQINTWSKEKGVKVTFETAGSETIEADKVISQSVAKGQKVSKADIMIIKLSLGKPMTVPDFSRFTFDESSGAAKNLPVISKQVYNDTVPYGGFISQSIPAGTQYFAKDTIPDIMAVYSLGRVYIKDLKGQTEGDLQGTFYNDYTSKGANIAYRVQYVNSPETKGTVVGQSSLNEFVPLSCTIFIQISNGHEK
ncbi:MAG: PASTA domain-containing protein [Lactococcus chungangensis]|uniref:PASTA domain-containing protein n=1 Tax=Pseudolactococcus chungangensis TaxID=451457 RepID=A0A847J5W2_9LACT|nr:PASTA domain-containing protein [Lactococcus chungangensis]